MPHSAATIQRQLDQAKRQLATAEENLNGMVPKKNPNWREANGRCKQLERRLAAHEAQRGSGTSEASDDE